MRQELPELHPDRAVEAKLVVQVGDLRFRRPVAQQRHRRVARQQPHQPEHQQRHQDHGHGHLEHPAAQDREHGHGGFYLSTEVSTKMLLPSGICTKPCTAFRMATG